MLLNKLPLEILIQIAEHLHTDKDKEEFSRTCRRCYYAILPYIWQHLSLQDTAELSILAKRLKHNDIWAERANHFVRDISLAQEKEPDRKYCPSIAASMFGIPSNRSQNQPLDQPVEKSTPNEGISRFGKKLLNLFPHVSNLVFDFREAAKNFRSSHSLADSNTSTPENTDVNTTDREANSNNHDGDNTTDDDKLPYSGSVSLINYKSDSSEFMHYMLSPFRTSQHVKLQASPVMSFCDDIDESILTDQDLEDLAKLGLTDLKKLELAYLDSNIRLETYKTLIQNLPSIQHLDIEWLFKPNKQEFAEICEIFKTYGSLEPSNIYTTKRNIFHVNFIRTIES
jgi:hypothetical protein